MADINDGALDWDMTEIDGGDEYILFEPGVYRFTVSSWERGRYDGGKNIGACPRASITLKVAGANGQSGTVTESMLLHTKTRWRIAQFFESMGFPKDPDSGKVQLDWNAIEGRSGFLKLKHRKTEDRDGNERTYNEVDKFLPANSREIPVILLGGQPQAAPAYQAPAPVYQAQPVPQAPQTQAPYQYQMPVAAPQAPASNQWSI